MVTSSPAKLAVLPLQLFQPIRGPLRARLRSRCPTRAYAIAVHARQTCFECQKNHGFGRAIFAKQKPIRVKRRAHDAVSLRRERGSYENRSWANYGRVAL